MARVADAFALTPLVVGSGISQIVAAYEGACIITERAASAAGGPADAPFSPDWVETSDGGMVLQNFHEMVQQLGTLSGDQVGCQGIGRARSGRRCPPCLRRRVGCRSPPRAPHAGVVAVCVRAVVAAAV